MFDAQLMKTFTDVKTGIRVICELSEHCMCNVSVDLSILIGCLIVLEVKASVTLVAHSNHADLVVQFVRN